MTVHHSVKKKNQHSNQDRLQLVSRFLPDGALFNMPGGGVKQYLFFSAAIADVLN